jgi:superfamily II DNA or RNA helicase
MDNSMITTLMQHTSEYRWLRDYQQEAIEAICEDWRTGKDNTLLVLPTGAGKTQVFLALAASMVQS